MIIGLFVVTAVLQLISAQGPVPGIFKSLPEECRAPPPVSVKPHTCCKMPQFFAEEDFKECGFVKPKDGMPHGPPDCSKPICVLKKNNLMKDDTTVDPEAVTAFLKKWSEEHSDFSSVVQIALDNCVGKELPGPPQACEPEKLMFCFRSTMFDNCPVWQDSEDCAAIKKHLEACKPYFQKM